MKPQQDVFTRVTRYLAAISGVLIMFIMLSTSMDVVTRYMGVILSGVTEVNEYALLYLTFLGTAWLLTEDGHVKIDVVITRIGPRTLAVFNIISSILGLGMCLVLFWYSGLATLNMFRSGTTTASILLIPMAPLLAPIPLGTLMLSIVFLRQLVDKVGALSRKRTVEVA